MTMRTVAMINAVCLAWLFCGSLAVAAPTVRNLNIRGLQAGGTTTLVFDGVGLLPEPRVVMNVPIAAQQIRPGATAARVEIDVTLDGSVTPGSYNLYLANQTGLSAKTLVAIDRLKQQPFAPTIETLPTALHGAISGSTTLRTAFNGQAGQAITCEVEAQRLAGKLRPVLHLYDPQGKHLAWSLPQATLRGDTRLEVKLPADGQYTLTLNDLQYAAGAPNHFRLKIGTWQYADLAFPLAVERGKPASLKLIGNLAAKQVNLAAAGDSSQMLVPWPEAPAASGSRPAVLVSDLPEIIETPGQPAGQEIAVVPAAINGSLSAPGEEDRYRVKVEPGSKLRLEVWADRLGSPLDGVLQLLAEKGNVLAQNDDFGPSSDAALDFQAPADMSMLTVALKDAYGRGGEPFVYRIVIAPAGKPAKADFQLLVDQEACNVTPGSKQLVKVRVDRRGYDGPIQLEFDKLPPGVTIEGAQIPAGATAALVALSGTTGPAPWFASLRGKSLDPAQPLSRLARVEPETAAAAVSPILTGPADELAMSVTAASNVAFGADWQPPAESKLVLGSKFASTVKCVRPMGFDGPVRVSLLTTQNPPRANNAIDNNRTLRFEPAASIEIPADAKAQAAWDAKVAAEKLLADAQTAQAAAAKSLADVQAQAGVNADAATKAKADADKRVQEAEQKKTAAEQAAAAASAAAKNDLEFKVFVPAELPSVPHELALRAELLSRDKQTVLATICTPIRPCQIANPLAVHYAGPPTAQVKLDAKTGAAVKLAGKIERLHGLASDVNVTLGGLPPGVAVPRVTLKPDKVDFELEVKFPPGFAAAALLDIKLFATGKLDPQAPLENRSSEIPITIELLPAT